MAQVRLKKRLGQHLLHDQQVLREIVMAAGVGLGDQVLEIGPGPGTLTRQLLEAVGPTGRVVAVELDTDWAPTLQGLATEAGKGGAQGDEARLELHFTDVLEADLALLLGKGRRFKVVANIPYYITAPIIERLLEHLERFERIALLMQAEVAERICARRGREVGSLSYYVQYHADPSLGLLVPPEAFTPPPQVDSRLLVLEPLSQPPVRDAGGELFPLIRTAFGERRKMLRRSLRGYAGLSSEQLEACLTACGLRGESRPEELDLQQLAALAEAISARRHEGACGR